MKIYNLTYFFLGIALIGTGLYFVATTDVTHIRHHIASLASLIGGIIVGSSIRSPNKAKK